MRRSEDQEIYTLSKEYSFNHLLKAIRLPSHLSSDKFINSLNPGEVVDLLNNPNNGNTVLYHIIISKREDDKLEFFKLALANGAMLNQEELKVLLIDEDLSETLRPEFFKEAMTHIYERADKISSLSDNIFALIFQIENFLSLCHDSKLGESLIKVGFPEEFRSYLAPILYKAGISHEDLVTKLCSYAPDKWEEYSLSEIGKADWLAKLTALAPVQEAEEKDEKALKASEVILDTGPNSEDSSRGSSNEFEEQGALPAKTGLRQRNVPGAEDKEADDKTPLLDKKESSTHHQDQVKETGSSWLGGWFK